MCWDRHIARAIDGPDPGLSLTEEQERGLKRLAASTGRKQSELIRAAVADYLAAHQPKDWKRSLEACFGMWADRDDVADLHERVREESEERLRRVWRRL